MCEGETDSSKVCDFEQMDITSQECLASLQPEFGQFGVSVAKEDGKCYKYKCANTIDGYSDDTSDWTARYTCAGGIFIS